MERVRDIILEAQRDLEHHSRSPWRLTVLPQVVFPSPIVDHEYGVRTSETDCQVLQPRRQHKRIPVAGHDLDPVESDVSVRTARCRK